ncbi:MAG: hypothetical protein AAGG38_12775 [Planctomycetota bacterium]
MPDPAPDSPDAPDPRPADEPETFDLAFDPEDEPAPPVAPRAAHAKDSVEPGGPAETIPLSEPEPEIHDPRAGKRPSKLPTADPAAEVGSGPADEIKAVSPAKARATREEQRVRAAQELAEADAKRKRVLLIVIGAFVVVGILSYLVVKLF